MANKIASKDNQANISNETRELLEQTGIIRRIREIAEGSGIQISKRKSSRHVYVLEVT